MLAYVLYQTFKTRNKKRSSCVKKHIGTTIMPPPPIKVLQTLGWTGRLTIDINANPIHGCRLMIFFIACSAYMDMKILFYICLKSTKHQQIIL